MKGNRLIVGALGAIVALAAGCTLTIDFDPRGVDVSLDGVWTINGGAANAASCSAAGIDTVQLVFFDGGVEYVYSDFRFNCADGFFDTRPQGVLDRGRYQTQWVALSGGTEIGRGPMLLLDVSSFSVTHAELAAVDFVTGGTPVFNPIGTDGSLGANWTLNGNIPDATSCAAAGVANVSVVFYDVNDTGRTNGVQVAMAPCADGVLDTQPMAILAAGTYLTSVDFLDASGLSIGIADHPNPTDVTTVPAHYILPTVDLEFVVPNNMSITFLWGAAGDSCAVAGAEDILWGLNDATGTPVISDTGTCASIGDLLIFDDLSPGTYELFVSADSADRLTKWEGTCTGLVHDGMMTFYDCAYDVM